LDKDEDMPKEATVPGTPPLPLGAVNDEDDVPGYSGLEAILGGLSANDEGKDFTEVAAKPGGFRPVQRKKQQQQQ
jgi:hypothetical protein